MVISEFYVMQTIFAENEDDLPRLIFLFKTTVQILGLKIAMNKTKSIVISKNSIK